MKLAEVGNGSTNTWDWSTMTGSAATTYFANNYFYPYIKTIKKCEAMEAGCWKDSVSLSNTTGYLDNTMDWRQSAILANGSSIYFWAGGAGSANPFPLHVQFWIDIDGPKKGKGMLGKDIFNMTLWLNAESSHKQGLLPAGLEIIPALSRENLFTDSDYGCNSSAGMYAGRYCGAIIVFDGWKISDDYPWN